MNAQTNTMEIPSWGKVVMLGDDCHLTFGNQPAVSGTTAGGYGVVGMTYYHDYFMIKKMVSAYAPITIDINNNVGIGHMFNMNSNNKLNINGNINTNGNIYALGTIISSDSRHKRNIKPISNLDNLFKVNSVQYNSSSEALKSQLDIFLNMQTNYLKRVLI